MSSTDTPSVFPPYISQGRFAPIDAQHQSASTYILVILCIIYSTLLLVIRGFLRRGTYGIDDLLITAATIVQYGQAAALFVALHRRLGASFALLNTQEISDATQAAYAANILFIFSLGLAKCSVICLIIRLFNLAYSRGSHSSRLSNNQKLCLSILGMTVLWIVGGIAALTIACVSTSFLGFGSSEQTCPGQVARWAFIMTGDMVTELMVLALAVVNVLPLQLARETKLQIIVSFGLRLPCIAFSVAHFHYINSLTHSHDGGLSVVPVLNLMQIELCWCLISATIPNLKAFLKSFNSGFGLGIDVQTAYFGTNQNSEARREYELGSVKNAQESQQSHAGYHNNGTQIIRQPSEAVTSVAGEERISYGRSSAGEILRSDGSVASGGSTEQIIRKDVQWNIMYEEGHGG